MACLPAGDLVRATVARGLLRWNLSVIWRPFRAGRSLSCGGDADRGEHHGHCVDDPRRLLQVVVQEDGQTADQGDFADTRGPPICSDQLIDRSPTAIACISYIGPRALDRLLHRDLSKFGRLHSAPSVMRCNKYDRWEVTRFAYPVSSLPPSQPGSRRPVRPPRGRPHPHRVAVTHVRSRTAHVEEVAGGYGRTAAVRGS